MLNRPFSRPAVAPGVAPSDIEGLGRRCRRRPLAPRKSARGRLEVQVLESRLLLHAGGGDDDGDLPPDIGTYPPIDLGSGTTSGTTTSGAAASSPLSSIPALS